VAPLAVLAVSESGLCEVVRQRRHREKKKAQREAEDDELSDDNNVNVVLVQMR
jgi:hypothetical protein